MPISPYSILIVPAIAILLLLEILIDMGIRMPWHDWIDANSPTWVAIINFIYLNIFGIIAITKIKDKFTEKQFKIYFISFLFSGSFVYLTLEKIPGLIVIISIAVLIFVTIKWGSRRSQIEKVFIKWESSSNDDK